ncbi:MAG: sigma-54-dependent Fis family transcriptional regulator [Rhodospirillales bacterium]|nr:sigma-54-dependent Fis family transcriptional regulator [Alphaproteobacteria bacterium]MCB9987111.1 sigma-54-dependent Fis family transcriptional regulator [Rhodospirillales bacterium]USO08130.1 MAG: sigma-54-dependent Fis family transcriptional regulator [Rhodospirillales bacterium]
MRLMIVGHLEGHISAAGKIALQRGAKVIHCEDTMQALGALRNGKGADVVMIDVKQNIAAFIDALDKERFAIPVVACGVGADTTAAVKAIKAGAKEYVPLPPDAELIAAVIEAVTEEQTAMIAADPAMQRVVKLADQVAPSEATVLITGESGTGKEVMSRYIHKKSKRKDGPFIALNCAAIPENLLESELFGHEKGAFTGAVARRIGKFEEASGGTLLLDEVTEMHPSLQAKLLRAIQERVIDRIGGKEPVKVNVRIIATTNRNLMDAVKEGQFREDLYFRLNVVNIALPPLRERKGDLPALAQMYVDKYAEVNGVPKKKLSRAALDKIMASGWRGNVRELENAMHRAILIALEDEIEADAVHTADAPETASAKPAPAAQAGQSLADVERKLILDTLEHTLGNRTAAAKILGISIRTLRNKLKEYGVSGE